MNFNWRYFRWGVLSLRLECCEKALHNARFIRKKGSFIHQSKILIDFIQFACVFCATFKAKRWTLHPTYLNTWKSNEILDTTINRNVNLNSLCQYLPLLFTRKKKTAFLPLSIHPIRFSTYPVLGKKLKRPTSLHPLQIWFLISLEFKSYSVRLY